MLLQISASTALAGVAAAMVAMPTALRAGLAQPQADSQAERPAGNALQFNRFDRLKGGAIHTPRGEELGTVEDLVIDRCSGDIRFLILDRGSALGLRATSLALPWSRISPVVTPAPARPGARPGADAGPVLFATVTPEQLDGMPQFESTESAAIGFDDWIDAMQRAFDDFEDWTQQDRADPLASAIDTGEQLTIEGEIVRIRRDRSFDAAEHVIAEVRSDDGRYSVALGPTWYTMGRTIPPMRGAEITIDGWKLTSAAGVDGTSRGEAGVDAVARTATIGEAQVQLRDERGTAYWASSSGQRLSSEPPDGAPGPADRDRLVLASRVVGASATANAQDAGQIKRLVIEQTTGIVAFVEVDPDANFLGLAENTQVVPWEVVASVAPGRVRFDASAQMLAAAPDSPQHDEAPAWFAEGANRDRVYEQFKLGASRRFGNGGG